MAKKKSNTAILMMEGNIGVGTASNIRNSKGHGHEHCDECYLRAPCAKRFKTNAGYMERDNAPSSPCYQDHNTKHNSFLTKYVLCALPNDWYKETDCLDVVIQKLSLDFKDLFDNGVTVKGKRWFCAVTGLKGDLRWYEKIAGLTRCFNKQIGRGLQMCHECEAGKPGLPWEDSSHDPCWSGDRYKTRPWRNPPSITTIPFENQNGQPEKILRRDLFHNTKMGVLRDFVASTILFLIFLGYFHDRGPGQSNAKDVCLQRAHRHFYLFCKATGGVPALRSFTPTFLNAKVSTDFGWINAKGSDVTLLVSWISVLVSGLLKDPIDNGHIPALQQMHLGAMCVKTWQHLVYHHGLWLPRHCATVLYQEFHDFLKHYNHLAWLCVSQYKFTGYAKKSKFHLIAHAKLELKILLEDPSIQWIPNPLIWSCEMNEDVIGKIARLSRRADTRLQTQRTLELYLCKCKAVHRRFLKSHGKRKS